MQPGLTMDVQQELQTHHGHKSYAHSLSLSLSFFFLGPSLSLSRSLSFPADWLFSVPLMTHNHSSKKVFLVSEQQDTPDPASRVPDPVSLFPYCKLLEELI